MTTTNKFTGKPTHVVIRKDTFNGTVKPWHADLHFDDGEVWVSWQAGYRSRSRMMNNIRASWNGSVQTNGRELVIHG